MAGIAAALFAAMDGVDIDAVNIADPTFPGSQITAGIWGDSLTNYCGLTTATTSNGVSWANGLATFTIASTALAPISQGERFRFVGTTGDPSVALNGDWTVKSVTATSGGYAQTFTVDVPTSLGSGVSSVAGIIRLPQPSGTGWFTWAQWLSGRFNLLYNGGQGGDTSTGLLARFEREAKALPIKPLFAFFLIGTNDSAIAAATTVANILELCNKARRLGMFPIVLTVPPSIDPADGSYGAAGSLTKQKRINLVNAGLKAAAGKNRLFKLIDVSSQLTKMSNGYMDPAFTWDGVHLSGVGARVVGYQVALETVGIASSPWYLTANRLDNYGTDSANPNVLDSAPWGTANATGRVNAPVTGTAADCLDILATVTGAGSCVASVVARTLAADGDTRGYNQRIVFTPGGLADGVDIRWNRGTDSSTHSRMVAGHTYEVRATAKFANVAGSKLRQFSLYLVPQFVDTLSGVSYNGRIIAAGFGNNAVAMDQTFPLGNLASADFTANLRSLPFTCPNTVTGTLGLGLRFQADFAGAGTACTIDLGAASLVDVT